MRSVILRPAAPKEKLSSLLDRPIAPDRYLIYPSNSIQEFEMLDAVIVDGSSAGLSAALQRV